jgi:hypothetical protein
VAAEATLAASLVKVENAPAAYSCQLQFQGGNTTEVAVSNVPAPNEVAVPKAPATADVAVSNTPPRTDVASFTTDPRSTRLSRGAGLATTMLDAERNSTIDEIVVFIMSMNETLMIPEVAIEGFIYSRNRFLFLGSHVNNVSARSGL